MRNLCLILLILLLPIRGWSTERMATYMAGGSAVSAMPVDCPMMIQATRGNEESLLTSQKSDRNCQVCQLCMTWVSQTTPVLEPPTKVALVQNTFRSDSFASVDLARLTKPPIH